MVADVFTSSLEIKFFAETAPPILCNVEFGIAEAHAICKQLGYFKAARYEEYNQQKRYSSNCFAIMVMLSIVLSFLIYQQF